jgi:hypothetical protein
MTYSFAKCIQSNNLKMKFSLLLYEMLAVRFPGKNIRA